MSRRKRLKITSSRLKILQKKLPTDACLIEQPIDLYYLTGLNLSAGRLLFTKSDAELFVDGRYIQVAEQKSPFKVSLDNPESIAAFCTKRRVKSLGFDGRYTSYERFERMKQQLKKMKLHPCSDFLASMRVIKDPSEIKKMQKSAALLWKGFQFLRKSLKVGVTEKELAKQFEIFCLERGAERLAFDPIIAFGPNSAMPHYRAQDARLKSGDIVLIDIGIVVDRYHSDMTRVVFYKREDPVLRRLYDIVRRAQKSALSLCRPGTTLKELDLAARKVMREENVEELYLHSLGHGIGLETHEFPRIKYNGDDKDVTLKSGMVFTVEPGLYIAGKGGVRYEDTILITPTGHTNFYPKEQ